MILWIRWSSFYGDIASITMARDNSMRDNVSPSYNEWFIQTYTCIWVRSWNCGCLVTWFCYQLIAKPGNKTAAVPWPDPFKYIFSSSVLGFVNCTLTPYSVCRPLITRISGKSVSVVTVLPGWHKILYVSQLQKLCNLQYPFSISKFSASLLLWNARMHFN